MSTTIPVYDFVRHESMRYEGNTRVVYPLVPPDVLAANVDTEPAGHRCSLAAVPNGHMCWLPYGDVWYLLQVKP